MRPVFVGNLDYDTRHSELDRLFDRYGRIDRIDMKSGFAFVYFEDESDADDGIWVLDGYPFGPGRRRLSVEWSRPRHLKNLARSIRWSYQSLTLFLYDDTFILQHAPKRRPATESPCLFYPHALKRHPMHARARPATESPATPPLNPVPMSH